jgi:hypothetical protein
LLALQVTGGPDEHRSGYLALEGSGRPAKRNSSHGTACGIIHAG